MPKDLNRVRDAALLIMLLSTAACSKGGNLVLEPGARPTKTNGAPFININQGGKALMWEITQTQATATSGVHGWVSIQPVASKPLAGGGHSAVINRISTKR